MLVLGGALTVLEYMVSRSAYDFPATSARYLVGVYLCMPLLVEPLWRGSQPLWWWLKRGRRHRAETPRLRVSAVCGLWLLGAVVALHGAGLVRIAQEAGNRQAFGVPANARDRQLLTFLQQEGATRFYTTYWACARLMFEAQERVTCSVINAANPFASGLNRIPAATSVVEAAPHPAYVFDRLAGDYDVFDPLGVDFSQRLPDQLGSRLASGDPRFAGYRVASFSGFLVYYFAGST